MDKEKLVEWVNSEIKKYEHEMKEAERLHLWHLREKYWAYLRIYNRCLKKIGGNGNNGNGHQH